MPLVKRYVDIRVSDDELFMSPLNVQLRSQGDEVVWRCQGGTVTIDFDKNGSPFNPVRVPAGGGASSGECLSGDQRSYGYTIRISRPGSASDVTIDPEVIVNDSTPPPDRRKRLLGPARTVTKRRPKRRKTARKPTTKRATGRRKGTSKRRAAKTKRSATRKKTARGRARRGRR